MQTKRQTLIEATTTTTIAFALSMVINWGLVLPLTKTAFENKVDYGIISLCTTLFFTLLAFTVTYCCRLYFDRKFHHTIQEAHNDTH